MAMKPEIKAEWVKALRSGEYKQGKSALRRKNDTYCCLGVLCELAVKAGSVEPGVLDGDTYEYGGREKEALFLPDRVAAWAGIIDLADHDAPVIDDLIGYNDEGMDFPFIADQIEQRL